MEMKHTVSFGSLNFSIIFILETVFVYRSIKIVSASIHEYNNEGFTPQSNAFFFHGGSEGLYASRKTPKGKSFIRFEDVSFLRAKESADNHNEMQSRSGLIEAIVLEVKDRENIGDSKSNAICCTPKLAQDKLCKVGEVILKRNSENPEPPVRIQTYFEGNVLEAKMVSHSIEINRTGMYYLYFMFCDPQLNATRIRGKTIWRNPGGYLPGKMVPLMAFYGIASLAYLLLGILWFSRFVKFWKDIIQLHYYITAVLALGMCEMALWYFEYANLNATGSRPVAITLWAVTVTSVKKTFSRLLLLVVSMGYGVVRPTVGNATPKLLLGAVYFVASEALELVEHLGNVNDFTGKAKLYLVLPVAFLDTWFILWIFSSLSQTLEKLQIRKNMVKLDLYRKFTNSLAAFVLLSIAWVGFELYFKASDPLSELWRIAWIIPSFWTLLAFSLLVVICILWAPSHNPTRYAYCGEETGEEDAAMISLTTGAGIGGKLERKEKGSSSTPTDLSLNLDLEEDKRE